jgi:hypothetical protein
LTISEEGREQLIEAAPSNAGDQLRRSLAANLRKQI